jgi:flavin reductase (DIM6/NTAB) family NADH-FMN oxidoreductase RutF
MKKVTVAEALACKYPEWVVHVITMTPEGQPNIMPAGWVMICNSTPPMMAVSVGLGRYTHTCLEESGEFVLAWPGEGQAEIIARTGACSGRDMDKFAELGLPTTPASEIEVPLLEGCAIALECVVVSQLELEDHSIFVGEVVAAHVADPPVDKLENFNGNYVVAEPRSN